MMKMMASRRKQQESPDGSLPSSTSDGYSDKSSSSSTVSLLKAPCCEQVPWWTLLTSVAVVVSAAICATSAAAAYDSSASVLSQAAPAGSSFTSQQGPSGAPLGPSGAQTPSTDKAASEALASLERRFSTTLSAFFLLLAAAVASGLAVGSAAASTASKQRTATAPPPPGSNSGATRETTGPRLMSRRSYGAWQWAAYGCCLLQLSLCAWCSVLLCSGAIWHHALLELGSSSRRIGDAYRDAGAAISGGLVDVGVSHDLVSPKIEQLLPELWHSRLVRPAVSVASDSIKSGLGRVAESFSVPVSAAPSSSSSASSVHKDGVDSGLLASLLSGQSAACPSSVCVPGSDLDLLAPPVPSAAPSASPWSTSCMCDIAVLERWRLLADTAAECLWLALWSGLATALGTALLATQSSANAALFRVWRDAVHGAAFDHLAFSRS